MLRNIPIPEGHLAFLAIGITLHCLFPKRMLRAIRTKNVLGWFLLAAGVILSGWAVKTVGDMEIQKPDRIITTGPYTFSRNPMYFAWTFIYSGLGLFVNTIWLIILLPLLAIFTHYYVVLPEETQMEQRFGEEYIDYKAQVRRYL